MSSSWTATPPSIGVISTTSSILSLESREMYPEFVGGLIVCVEEVFVVSSQRSSGRVGAGRKVYIYYRDSCFQLLYLKSGVNGNTSRFSRRHLEAIGSFSLQTSSTNRSSIRKMNGAEPKWTLQKTRFSCRQRDDYKSSTMKLAT